MRIKKTEQHLMSFSLQGVKIVIGGFIGQFLSFERGQPCIDIIRGNMNQLHVSEIGNNMLFEILSLV